MFGVQSWAEWSCASVLLSTEQQVGLGACWSIAWSWLWQCIMGILCSVSAPLYWQAINNRNKKFSHKLEKIVLQVRSGLQALSLTCWCTSKSACVIVGSCTSLHYLHLTLQMSLMRRAGMRWKKMMKKSDNLGLSPEVMKQLCQLRNAGSSQRPWCGFLHRSNEH